MKSDTNIEVKNRSARCPSHMHGIHIKAGENTKSQEEAKQWASDMQAQCLALIHRLAIRENVDDLPAIEFIAGVGISCSELEASLET